VWFGLTWSLELYQQTNARLWRQGQSAETVVVQHIVTKGTIDERILKVLSKKDSTQAALIDAVKADADLWLAKEVYGRQTQPVDFQNFYNIHFYPYWWDVIDLYEATGDKKYLSAAVEGAFHTLAGQWSHPRHPQGDITIHPDGSQVTYHPVWHKNDHSSGSAAAAAGRHAGARRACLAGVAGGPRLEQPSTYTAFRGP
jgi:hypothetical protein